MKPHVLPHQSRRFAYEIALDTKSDLPRKITKIRSITSSHAVSSVFLLIAQGAESPRELASRLGKSKFLVSQYLSKLKKNLIDESSRNETDLRRKRYSVSWQGVGDIFRQDHALELELYENHLLAEGHSHFRGRIGPIKLVVLGTGKVGVLKTVRIEHSELIDNSPMVSRQMNVILEEFIRLFRGYLLHRRYRTLQEYFLGIYKELSESFQRLPQSSELRRFYRFTGTTFERLEPLEDIWAEQVREKNQLNKNSFQTRPLTEVKLFTEAGKTDFAGNYILSAEAAEVIGPDTRLRIYPSYTYAVEGIRFSNRRFRKNGIETVYHRLASPSNSPRPI